MGGQLTNPASTYGRGACALRDDLHVTSQMAQFYAIFARSFFRHSLPNRQFPFFPSDTQAPSFGPLIARVVRNSERVCVGVPH